jgi:hypothetical protein
MNPFAEFAAIVGIDWADKKHDLCLKPLGSDRLEFAVLTHTPEAIDDRVNGLRQRFGGAPIAVCLESRKVPLIHALLKYDFLALVPVNPQTLWKRVRLTRGCGTRAASRAMKSRGSKMTCVVPSR